jgi:hypothetical protein
LGFESPDNSIAVMLFIFIMTMMILRCAVIMAICGSRISWCCPLLTQSFFKSSEGGRSCVEKVCPEIQVCKVWRLQMYVCMDLESFADLVLAFFDNGEFDSTILQSQISTWSWLSPGQNLSSNGQLNSDYACCSSTPRAVPSLLNVQYNA